MTYVIAFDFESFGPIPSINGFSRLGAVLGNLTSGEIVDTFSEYANQDGYCSDINCIETFWKQHPDKYQEALDGCANSNKTPQEVIALFYNWIKKFTEKRGTCVYLITNCSTYDSGILKTFSIYDTLKLVDRKIVRDIIDTTSFYLGVAGLFMTEDIVDGSSFNLACTKLGLKNFRSSVPADHDPVNDSIVIFEQWKFINDALIDA